MGVKEAVAKKYGWDDAFNGRYPNQVDVTGFTHNFCMAVEMIQMSCLGSL